MLGLTPEKRWLMSYKAIFTAWLLFLASLIMSWVWIGQFIYELPFKRNVLLIFITFTGYIGMWMIIQNIHQRLGWQQIGIIAAPKPLIKGNNRAKSPMIMQFILDGVILLALNISFIIFAGRFLSLIFTLILSTIVVNKWRHYFEDNKQSTP